MLAQQGDLAITADRLEKEGTVFSGRGNVVADYEDVHLEADEVSYDEATGESIVAGRVRFTRVDEHLTATRAKINLKTKTGVLVDASGALGPGFFVTASEAQRLEDGRYYLKNATVTTCDGPSAGWTFGAARVFIDPGRRVSARNSVFKLEGIPIFYMPYVIAPSINRSRSTGFLIPSTSTSTTKGRGFQESFYWVINRSADATFTAEYFTKRGPAAAVDFRTTPNEGSRFEVNSFFAKDRKGQGGQSVLIQGQTRFGGEHRAVVDMNLVSSFVFRQVYEEGFNVISSPIEHSLGFLTSNRPGISFNFLYTRTGIFFTDQPTVILRKFPTFEASVAERRLGPLPLYFSAEAGLAGIARRDAAIKTSTFGQRLDVHPVLEIPVIRSNAFNWSHRIGVRNTTYTHSMNPLVTADALNRFSMDYVTHFSGPQVERDFGSFKHVIGPAIEYHYLAGVDRFRRTIVVDDTDLVTDTNDIEYSITNRFFTGHEVFSWRIAQKYFFDPTFGGAIVPGRRNVFGSLLDLTGFAFADGRRRFSPIVSTMRISTSPNTSTDLQVDYDTKNRLFRSAGIIGGLSRGQSFGSISYFFTRGSAIQLSNNQLRTTIGYGNDQKVGFSGALSLAYDIERTLFQGSVAQFGYNTDCYGLSFEFMQFDIGARKESRFRFAISLKDIGSYGTLRRQERLF